ncbi:catechol 2,3-dioxygenase [Nocardioides marmoribigeumensis]|uniref:Metapyrocatechase n=1 Tax=Nocardioides marmoribigeumensis TaxID=433649 RepID=A0ABU2BPY9_9ACTN|nr:catechol 2,3-dioxygenase [Nocardioides marmoribigeumensis]MDR7360699.1 catechol 2,3-dioxygenase [Nocardioides marmoribigeumensis]
MTSVNGVTAPLGGPDSEGGAHVDLAEGTPAGTRRVTAPWAPPDGTPRRDPSDSRQAGRATSIGRPRGVLRLGHVDVTVTDLDLATAYYTGVMGMEITALTEDSVYLKCWDEEDHHSLRLRYAPRMGMDLMSFKVHHEDDLAELEDKVTRYGFPVERLGKGESLGQGESIRFFTPSGHVMELVADVEKVGTTKPRHLPDKASDDQPFPRDFIAPPRMDHMLINAEEVGESTRFFMDVLGFRITEQLLDGNGHQLGTWLERSHSPHDLAIVQGPNGGLHHFAFWLDDWDDVRDAADVLAYNGIQLDVGPTRHGITRGSTIYFFDPLGTRNEVFTGGYRPDPDFPTVTWTEDNIGRAVFYYEGEVNDRFLRVHT